MLCLKSCLFLFVLAFASVSFAKPDTRHNFTTHEHLPNLVIKNVKKTISFSTQGQRADIGSQMIYRMLPNRYAEAVGPFVFLDYIPLFVRAANDPVKKRGTHPHAHRGIATLTYVLSGEAEHYDSRGHHAIVYSGGVQWMKSGSGIIHEESFGADSQRGDRTLHGFQFWINLPSKIKSEDPEYLALQAADVPQRTLDNGSGWLKVIVGEYEDLASKIPNYSKQFLYHIHLEPHKQFNISAEAETEYAAFTVGPHIVLNDTAHEAAEFIELDRNAGTIELVNNSDTPNDVLLFGGERYTEPIVADGPFVMNTHAEIAQAYLDLHNGKYGTITKGDK